MDNHAQISPEELEKMVEKAKRDLQAKLDSMTPEERAQAEMKASKTIAADQAAMQNLLDDAAAVMGGYPPQREFMERNTAQEHHTNPYPGAYMPNAAQQIAQNVVRFCPNCGARADGGKFCEYCGSAL